MLLPALAAVNAGLATVPVKKSYDLCLDIAGQAVRCSSTAERPYLLIEAVEGAEGVNRRAARTTVRVDSLQTFMHAAMSGHEGLLPLLSSGKLRLSGDLGQLQDLQRELAAHKEALEATAAKAAGAAGSACQCLAADVMACMGARCGRLFSASTPRQQCGGCGGVFCKACLPEAAAAPPTLLRSRPAVCPDCRLGRRRPAVSPEPPSLAAAATATSGGAPAASPTALGALGAHDASGELLLNWSVEQQLRSLRLASRAVSAVGLVVFLALAWSGRAPLWNAAAALAAGPRWLHATSILALASAVWLRCVIWRLTRVAWVLLVLAASLLWTRRRLNGLSGDGRAAVEEVMHRVHARFIKEAVADLSGFYVKVAQTLSVWTALPDAYNAELSKLQDQMPADSLEEVERTLEEELGADWRSKVAVSPGPPLGSATIAQVHRATLYTTGSDGVRSETPAVIKVQHRQMKGHMVADIFASRWLARLASALAPTLFDGLGDSISELAALTRSELDFRLEAANQQKARDSAAGAGLNVVIPAVFHGLVTRRVLAMEFVEGARLSAFAKCASDEDRCEIVRSLIEFFAFSFTRAGIFNCDPHPGNLLVTPERKLVVLDWGQARHLTAQEMEACCRLFVAVSLEDPFMLAEVGRAFGLSYKVSAALAMINALRFLMRDSRPLELSREDVRALERTFAGFGDFKELQGIQYDAKDILRGPLMPLSKTVDLLHNVSTRLSVNMSLLHVFTHKGLTQIHEDAAREGAGPPPAMRQAEGGLVLGLAPPPQGGARGPLEARLEGLLREAHAQGEVLGAQVVVLDAGTGQVLCDFALGHGSYLQPRPVTRRTLFNVGELGKLELAFAVLRLVEQGELALSATFGELWPEAAGLRDITVEQVLSHTAGLWQLLPDGVQDVAGLCDVPGVLEKFETDSIAPVVEPGTAQKYHHLTFGWLLAGLLRRLGKTCRGVLGPSSFITSKDQAHTASGAHGVAEMSNAMGSASASESVDMLQDLNEFLSMARTGRRAAATAEERAGADCFLALRGREPLLAAAVAEQPGFAEGALPGASAYATAARVAALLLGASRGQLLRRETVQDMLRSRRVGEGDWYFPRPLSRFRRGEWGLGAELVPLPGREAEKAWGHTAASGSFGLVIPGQRPIVAAVLLNREDSWRRGVSPRLLQELADFAAGLSPASEAEVVEATTSEPAAESWGAWLACCVARPS